MNDPISGTAPTFPRNPARFLAAIGASFTVGERLPRTMPGGGECGPRYRCTFTRDGFPPLPVDYSVSVVDGEAGRLPNPADVFAAYVDDARMADEAETPGELARTIYGCGGVEDVDALLATFEAVKAARVALGEFLTPAELAHALAELVDA